MEGQRSLLTALHEVSPNADCHIRTSASGVALVLRQGENEVAIPLALEGDGDQSTATLLRHVATRLALCGACEHGNGVGCREQWRSFGDRLLSLLGQAGYSAILDHCPLCPGRQPHAVDAVSQRVARELHRRLRTANHFAGVICDCDGGTVVLRGQVASYYQKQMAQEIARRVEGVTWIINDIEVVGGSGRAARTSDCPPPIDWNRRKPR